MKLTGILAGLLVTTMMSSFAHADAKELYESKCAKCHGADGDGTGRAGKSLKHKPTVFNAAGDWTKHTDEELFLSIKKGGEAIKLSKDMEAYGSLSDDEVKGLVAYIKTLKK